MIRHIFFSFLSSSTSSTGSKHRATHTQTHDTSINLSKPITIHTEPHTHKHKPSNHQQSHTHKNHQTSWSQQRLPHPPPKPPIRNPCRRFETQAAENTQKNAIIVVRNAITDQQTPSLPRLCWTLLWPTASQRVREGRWENRNQNQNQNQNQTKTKATPSEQTHSKKIITGATIRATDDQPNRSTHQSTDPPFPTHWSTDPNHHQPIPAHRSKPSSLIHADPTSKIQNPAPMQVLNERDVREGVRREELWLVRDKERKWESEWERTVERIKYWFWFYNCAIVQF